MESSVELPYEENITTKRFWELANDLLYTKVYYNQTSGEYFTKCFRNFRKSLRLNLTGSSEKSNGTATSTDYEDDDGDDDDRLTDSELDVCSEDEINTLLVSYLTLVCNYSGHMCLLMEEREFYSKVSKFFIEYKSYENNLQFCIRKMLSLLNHIVQVNRNNLGLDSNSLNADMKDQINLSIESNEKMIKVIGWILFSTYESNKDKMQFILTEFQGFETLAAVFDNYALVSKNTVPGEDPFISNYSPYLQMFFDLCKYHEFEDEELAFITKGFVKWLLKNLKASSKDEDALNFMRFKTLLILNEQFMVSVYSKDKKEDNIPNLVFLTMIERNKYFQSFIETLILNFNREIDPVFRILMLKLLYLIFTTSHTCQWIYLNDLKVIIDILIRELFNLSITKDEPLLNTYLRVLYPLLMFSNYKDDYYKADNLQEVLKYLVNAEPTSANTRRLAQRSLQLDVFKTNAKARSLLAKEISVPPLNKTRSRSSTPVVPPSPREAFANSNGQHKFIVRIDSSLSSSQSSLDSPTGIKHTDSQASLSSITSMASQDSTNGRGRKLRPPPPPPRRLSNANNGNAISNHVSGSELSLSRAKAPSYDSV